MRTARQCLELMNNGGSISPWSGCLVLTCDLCVHNMLLQIVVCTQVWWRNHYSTLATYHERFVWKDCRHWTGRACWFMVLSKLIVKKLSFTTFHTIFLVCVIVQYVANVHEDDIQCYSEKSHHTKLSCLPNSDILLCGSLFHCSYPNTVWSKCVWRSDSELYALMRPGCDWYTTSGK